MKFTNKEKREKEMKEKIRKYMITAICMAAFILPMLQPLTVRAAETGQTVTLSMHRLYNSNATLDGDEFEESYDFTVSLDSGYELVAFRQEVNGDCQVCLYLYNESSKEFRTFIPAIDVNSCVSSYSSHYVLYKNGKLSSESSNENEKLAHATYSYLRYDVGFTTTQVNLSWSGMHMFDSLESAQVYVKTGTTDGLIEPPKDEVNKSWFLKNVNFSLRADDSPTSEAGEDATYVKFTWDIDNLQDGDLLEIKTHSYLKKIGGDQIIGFHDFITHANNVSAYSGEYELSQYDATKAWFATLENKPLIFKSYDTDAYYLRPWRNGVAGGWVRISMSRATPSSSPYVDKVDYGDFDEDGEWIVDDDLTFENGGGYGIDQNGNIIIPEDENLFTGTNISNIMSKFFDFMKSLPALFGDLPALLNQTIGFLPVWVIGAICAAILVAIILRIVGR